MASTRDAVTLACWPPGPDERLVRSSISASGMAVWASMRIGSSTPAEPTLAPRDGRRRGTRGVGRRRARRARCPPPARSCTASRRGRRPPGAAASPPWCWAGWPARCTCSPRSATTSWAGARRAALGDLGVTVHAAWRDHPQRTALVHVDSERRAGHHGGGPARRPGRRRRPALGAAGPRPTPCTSPLATPAPWRTPAAPGCWWPPRARCRRAARHGRAGGRAGGQRRRSRRALRGRASWIPSRLHVLRTEAEAGGSWEGPGGPGRWDGAGAARAGASTASAAATRSPRA